MLLRKCKAIPSSKSELIKMCEDLGLRTTKADKKLHAAFNMPVQTHMVEKKNFTKKQLIIKIAQFTMIWGYFLLILLSCCLPLYVVNTNEHLYLS